MSEKEFIQSLNELGIEVNKTILNNLQLYYQLLIEWNKKLNLTRIVDEKEVYLKHFYDSLTICKVIDLTKEKNLLDFGTGAGFPGLVLKIVFPNLKITLVDSLQKRINFLNEVIKELKLENITTIHSRIEDLSLENYDIITTRAVANLTKLLDYTHKQITKSTKFIPLKGHIEEELDMASSNLKKYNLKITKIEKFLLPKEESQRTILIIEKKH